MGALAHAVELLLARLGAVPLAAALRDHQAPSIARSVVEGAAPVVMGRRAPLHAARRGFELQDHARDSLRRPCVLDVVPGRWWGRHGELHALAAGSPPRPPGTAPSAAGASSAVPGSGSS